MDFRPRWLLLKVSLRPWQLFRRHPTYICVPLSEWDVWVGASSVAHRVVCPDTTCLSAAAWAQPWQLCVGHLERVTLLFFFVFFALFLFSLSLVSASAVAVERQLDVFAKPNATVWLVCAGIASFPFLNSTAPWSRLWRLVRAASFLFLDAPRTCETSEVLFSQHVTCLQEIWVQSRNLVSGMFVPPPLNSEKDLQLYFYPSRRRRRPWLSGALGFISEIAHNDPQSVQTNFNKLYSLAKRRSCHRLRAAIVWDLLNLTLNLYFMDTGAGTQFVTL